MENGRKNNKKKNVRSCKRVDQCGDMLFSFSAFSTEDYLGGEKENFPQKKSRMEDIYL